MDDTEIIGTRFIPMLSILLHIITISSSVRNASTTSVLMEQIIEKTSVMLGTRSFGTLLP